MAVSVSLIKKLAEILWVGLLPFSACTEGASGLAGYSGKGEGFWHQELHYKPSALALSLRNKKIQL